MRTEIKFPSHQISIRSHMAPRPKKPSERNLEGYAVVVKAARGKPAEPAWQDVQWDTGRHVISSCPKRNERNDIRKDPLHQRAAGGVRKSRRNVSIAWRVLSTLGGFLKASMNFPSVSRRLQGYKARCALRRLTAASPVIRNSLNQNQHGSTEDGNQRTQHQ
jgi:hypothetical protein